MDNHTCQWCQHIGKQKAGNQPHHIIPRSRSKALRHDIRNGITLCFYCHHRRLLDEPVEFARFIQQWLPKHRGITYDELKELSKIKTIKKEDL